MGKHLKQLRTLRLMFYEYPFTFVFSSHNELFSCNLITSKGLAVLGSEIGRNLPNLKDLYLIYWGQLKFIEFDKLYCDSLVLFVLLVLFLIFHFSISQVGQIKDDGIKIFSAEIARHLTHLKFLDLNFQEYMVFHFIFCIFGIPSF